MPTDKTSTAATPLLDGPQWRALLEARWQARLTELTELSLAFVESLTRHRGGILNVASIAAFVPGPGMAVYYARKAYVLSFSEALHHELAGRGVRVTALCPGPVATEFQARSGQQRRNPRMLMVPARRVARIGYHAFMRGERVVVAGLGNRMVAALLPPP